jgi:hypothetical protein
MAPRRLGLIVLIAVAFEAIMEAVRLDDSGSSLVNVLWQSLWLSVVLVTADLLVGTVRRRRSGWSSPLRSGMTWSYG